MNWMYQVQQSAIGNVQLTNHFESAGEHFETDAILCFKFMNFASCNLRESYIMVHGQLRCTVVKVYGKKTSSKKLY